MAIQRTRIRPTAEKIERRMLGQASRSAVKLDRDENVTLGLVVTEGCETGLAARQLGCRPVWALGSANAIALFPILAGIDALIIHAEPESQHAAHTCGLHWREAGREVTVLSSLYGSDLNDAIRARGI
jgi:hypothetical protein